VATYSRTSLQKLRDESRRINNSIYSLPGLLHITPGGGGGAEMHWRVKLRRRR